MILLPQPLEWLPLSLCTTAHISTAFTFVSIMPSVTSPISDRMANESGSPYFAPDLGLSLQNSLWKKKMRTWNMVFCNTDFPSKVKYVLPILEWCLTPGHGTVRCCTAELLCNKETVFTDIYIGATWHTRSCISFCSRTKALRVPTANTYVSMSSSFMVTFICFKKKTKTWLTC